MGTIKENVRSSLVFMLSLKEMQEEKKKKVA